VKGCGGNLELGGGIGQEHIGKRSRRRKGETFRDSTAGRSREEANISALGGNHRLGGFKGTTEDGGGPLQPGGFALE